MKTLTATPGQLLLNVKKIANLSPKQSVGQGKCMSQTLPTTLTF